ncbi:hypothetical protein K2173_012048 [Erythroxylum novogranatense]|uniref:Zinc finger PHD-type domain-containing protein n=1 Tax=Erythroxylum novogranatense TaxID=1862640 RepID=A0AAV8TEV8_9ROSI|nr:hypothetical protein K2173_012048 [Erythroxylum novogranatense]
MVVNARPIKRMKRRVTADLQDFVSFPSPDDCPRAPFRTNIKSFLNEHALCPPPASLIPHLLTWQMSFRVGDLANAVVSLDVVEEDVARSRSIYCNQCRVVGWSGHPVCTRRYHFIIKADGNSIGGYHKPCACCGDIPHFSEPRCKTCNRITTADDVEDWVYHQLEDTTHLLHAVVHANGYGHLLRVNGREGGSRVVSGRRIMDFWDRLCSTLGVRKVSVMDVSKKYGLEYRLLHAITSGRSWYGNWGYEFGAGSFGLTVDAYKSAIETLSSRPLCVYLSQGRKPRTRLQDLITFYQSLSDCELVNTRDLFCYLMSLIDNAQKSPKIDSSCKKLQTLSSEICPWSRSDIDRVEEAMLRVLRAVSGSNWVSWRTLRGAVCKVGTPELLDYCLKEIGGKRATDGMIVVARCNHDSGALEYRLESENQPSNEINSGITAPVITCPSKENLVADLRFLYECLLHPRTMASYGPEASRTFAISSAEKLLDCKQFVKHYMPEKSIAIMNPTALCINCEVENSEQVKETGSHTHPEMLVLPPNATLADLKLEATRALQDVYLIFRRFQTEELVGYSGVDDSTQVKLLLGSAVESVQVRGKCLGKHSLSKYKMERGIERWTVECSCGAKDDDGERMLACDVCGVWQHTRCSGICDSESVPAKFICPRCTGYF